MILIIKKKKKVISQVVHYSFKTVLVVPRYKKVENRCPSELRLPTPYIFLSNFGKKLSFSHFT